MTQIIFEAEKKVAQYAPLFTLREIIQNGTGSISGYLAKLGAFPADYAEKQAQQAAAVNEAVLQATKSSYDSMKQSLDERVANAATAAKANTAAKPSFDSNADVTPDLPNPNRGFGN